jgi:hypothetical protein
MSRINPHRQIQKDAENVEQHGLLEKFMKSCSCPDGRVQETCRHKLSSYHQKKRYGNPGKDSGKEKIQGAVVLGKGRGMDCDHKQGGTDPKDIKSAVISPVTHLHPSIQL